VAASAAATGAAGAFGSRTIHANVAPAATPMTVNATAMRLSGRAMRRIRQ
jgi:hypothetical protein